MFDDTSSSVLRVALDSLAQRQRVIANNISNVETPGYLANKVKFEEALASAVSSGASPEQIGTFRAAVEPSLEPTRPNGSNVNLDQETLANIDTGLRYQLMLNALDGKYKSLRTVISGQ